MSRNIWQRIRDNFRKKGTEQPLDTPAASATINYDKLRTFAAKYWWIILLIIPLVIGIHLRVQPAFLPVTDDWATNTVHNFYRNTITQQVAQQYPNVPTAQRESIINDQFEETLAQNADRINAEIQQVSQQYKDRLQNEDGQTYLLDIDTYLWYGQTKNYIQNGHPGTDIVDGESVHMNRNGREGLPSGFPAMAFLAYVGTLLTPADALTSLFYLSTVLMVIAITLSFFIGKKIAGYPGAFTSAMLIAMHTALLSRTITGDSDPLITVLQIATTFFFIYALESDTTRQVALRALLGGIAFSAYMISHPSWWSQFDFILGALIAYALFIAARNYRHVRQLHRNKKVQHAGLIGIILFVSSMIFYTLLSAVTNFGPSTWSMIQSLVSGPLGFLRLKEVGITTIWPNVFTTVAELNPSSIPQAINGIGGELLFALGIVGIVFLLTKAIMRQDHKHFAYGAFLAAWMIGSLYAAQTSIRFIAFVVPPYAFSVGAFACALFLACAWLARQIKVDAALVKGAGAIALAILFLPIWSSAIATAESQVPHMDDAWWTTLTHIRDTSDQAIITSWWDFGHWFAAVAERKVTFDGGDQGYRIHWVGKSLLEDDEETSVGILHMLNCAQEQAPYRLSHIYGANNDAIARAVHLIYKAVTLDRADAHTLYLSEGLSEPQANELIELTHCQDTLDQYYITSEDMVSKAGVWGHFGSWNFTRALMYNRVKNTNRSDALDILITDFNMTSEQASRTYQEISTTNADQWVSPWPGYLSGPRLCATNQNNTLSCPQTVQGGQLVFDINLNERTARVQGSNSVPNTLVIPTAQSTIEVPQEGNPIGASVTLIPTPTGYNSIVLSPQQANSIFTRLFFMEGHGLTHFTKFDDKTSITGQRIITWRVNFDGNETLIHPALIEKTEVAQGDTVRVHYIGSYENGTVFDSSIHNWHTQDITATSQFEDYESTPLTFVSGRGQVIRGFDNAVIGMSTGEQKTITIPPADAYGTDPSLHPLGNKTLVFKIQVQSIR